jgi:hypothetical protein
MWTPSIPISALNLERACAAINWQVNFRNPASDQRRDGGINSDVGTDDTSIDIDDDGLLFGVYGQEFQLWENDPWKTSWVAHPSHVVWTVNPLPFADMTFANLDLDVLTDTTMFTATPASPAMATTTEAHDAHDAHAHDVH